MRVYMSLVCFLLFQAVQAQILDKSWRDIVTDSSAEWYASSEAREIAENVLLYQRDIGGWPKNIQMQEALSTKEKQELSEIQSTAKGVTTDNGATFQEMLFLSKIHEQQPDERYRTAFLKALGYLLEAQYPNGGWPQFYPLKKGYATHITYNDDSMVNIMNVLKEVKDNSGYYSIQPPKETLERVKTAFDKGVSCILQTQYVQDGILTGWCAQHDEVTLEPAMGRAYELPSLSGKESAKIVLLLMSIEDPSIAVMESVASAHAWLQRVKIEGLREVRTYDDDGKVINKVMVQDEEAPPLWARFMELENNRPFFCDRDGIKKYSLDEIGAERRNGYGWYTNEPKEVLKTYDRWVKAHNVIEKLKAKTAAPKDPFNVTVAKDGTGDYSSIQDAINNAKSFPYEKITIMVKNGIYKEKVRIYEWNTHINLIGESKEQTIITYDDYFDKLALGRNSTFHTPTLSIDADDVLVKNLTIENSAGEVGQAVALAINSNRVAMVNCNLLGNQDTVYASGNGKQYFKDCYIEGTTDFIFGNATAFFENCEIHSKKDSYITAASTDEMADFGFVFKNCKLTAAENVDEVYLGRPWRIDAQTVFMDSDMGDHILPVGWDNWSKPDAEKTAFYAEYKNRGKGYAPERRVSWSKQLKKSQAKKYNIKNILGEHKKSSKKEWYETL
ncbi:pectate lyase [Nonlabens sp. YIK11]|uniref:pectate lyase n=1 Tax=Nonlabens sp. YIK11 TaxID=1453349 RepID=UPI0006DD0166|nr:pectate lyase [Nonlabens sp. YIK11]KQC34514.1 pectate lyase [Nonlabens sp. YIK11]